MKFHYLVLLFITLISGCSSVPGVKLTKQNFEQLQTVKLEASPNDNTMLTAISTVEIQCRIGDTCYQVPPS
ncbi:hypothetical protein [Shewanella inventionis]|uniref:Lipoprotein n=1 Tax=Shewanella inventionis TaxID=1738770 RepID=A0ABQ1JVN7_9GAMM|nr:hypothetical protein [Shewanella inventionis]MCL1160227.1 hypothetical protein [Shewanella inventionis]GGB77980.1 hypothetical protein GCM10011607_42610 [Shewanella inventionis]